ncbi:AEC family transporter [Caldibacillus lycopersici]|uniref:AEC family transporter n=1 Tax=Perspicuibacillus lycopersici TaxID=1325689 RepID=A0AAE3IX37_9BACI|nr:AEC family transporter [Perspicuibacillus lycopersici]MCU9615183.1 AEC family transporter [Perspicuibacillus lycopersici]
MAEFFIILYEIILPVFVLIGVGFILQKKFQLNIQTLTKLNIYFVVPGFIFVRLYQTELSFSLFSKVFLFIFFYICILFTVSRVFAKIMRLENGKKTTFSNSVIFFNSGNYAVPVNDLVFKGDPFAMSIQVIVLALQNIFTFSYGIFSLQSLRIGKLRAALGYLKMPVLYAMLLALVFNLWNVPLPSFIWVPANYIADAMIGIALITLGAQVARIKIKSGLANVSWSLFIRLLLGPAIAFLIIWVFGLEGTFAQALFIASSTPTAVNSAIIAEEYDNYPEFAAQIVMYSTLFSSITVSFVIYCSRLLF